MISSKALKNFVKMHEYKLNAKINERRAEKLDSRLEREHWGVDCLDDHHQKQARGHWQALKSDISARDDRPKSRYFNFILTATHQ